MKSFIDIKVGDKVRAIAPVAGFKSLIGKIGTIRGVRETGSPARPWAVSIEFDEPFSGAWDCDGKCAPDKGRQTADPAALELVEPICISGKVNNITNKLFKLINHNKIYICTNNLSIKNFSNKIVSIIGYKKSNGIVVVMKIEEVVCDTFQRIY